MSNFTLETFLPYQLATLSARVSKDFARHYRERFGISVSEWRVMAHLSQEDAVSVRREDHLARAVAVHVHEQRRADLTRVP